MLDWLSCWLDSKSFYTTLFNKAKQNKTINYYIIGPKNHNYYEFIRNPFYGIKQAIGVPNINPTAWIDIRIFYMPIDRMSTISSGSKKTLGKPLIRIPWFNNYVLFEIRKPHPNDGLYYNGFITFLIATSNKHYPWISFNFRPIYNRYLNCGIGWEAILGESIAEVGLKCRIANHKSAIKWNPGVVAGSKECPWEEGHI